MEKDIVADKVQSLFKCIVGDAATRLDGSYFPDKIRNRIARVLSEADVGRAHVKDRNHSNKAKKTPSK